MRLEKIKELVSKLYLEFSEVELIQMAKEFENFEKAEILLKDINTEKVEPCFSPITKVLETIEVDPYFNNEDVFLNTETVDNYVAIKRVLK